MVHSHFDHIIAGGGLAGLSLAYRLSQAPAYKDKKLLIIDKDDKKTNDRTWSFWSQSNILFESIVHHRWTTIKFADFSMEREFPISPYQYKMIRGIDFYNYTLEKIRSSPNITLAQAEIKSIKESQDLVTLDTEHDRYTTDYLFKSYPEKLEEPGDQFVWQHFKGWIIETVTNTFDPQKAVFMDFRVEQADDTRFFYVLPLSPNKALVEFTIFSKTVSPSTFYDPFLNKYITEKLGLEKFTVLEEELGAIPMSTHKFQQTRSQRIIPIGTNAGSVKASSGYAFMRIQKHMDELLPFILDNSISAYRPRSSRYNLYDRIMLNAILTGKTEGATVFTKLFQKLPPQTIFKFLDEEGSIFTDLRIFTAPPTLPFLKAFLEEIFK